MSKENKVNFVPSDALKINPRYLRALEMRMNDATLNQIGTELSVTRERAREMVRKAEKLQEQKNIYDNEFAKLSARIRNSLFLAGFDTKEKIIDGVCKGLINPSSNNNNKINNYGIKSHKELLDWLGIDEK